MTKRTELEDDGDGEVYVRQACANCRQSFVVRKSEAGWRNLCHPCYRAKKSAKPHCSDCKIEVDRVYLIAGYCPGCYAQEVVRNIQRRSKKTAQPILPTTKKFQYRMRPLSTLKARSKGYDEQVRQEQQQQALAKVIRRKLERPRLPKKTTAVQGR